MSELYHAGQPTQHSLFSDADYVDIQQLTLFDPESPIVSPQTPKKLKKCTACEEYKPITEYTLRKNGRYEARCKECIIITDRKRRAVKHSAKILAKQAEDRRLALEDPRLLHSPALPPPPILSRTCPLCNIERPISEYQIRKEKPVGRCKQCAAESRKPIKFRCNIRTKQRNYHMVKEGHKLCNTCFVEKPHTDFAKDSAQRDGYRGRCKDCYHDRWEHRTPDQKEAYRIYRQQIEDANRETIKNREKERNKTPKRQKTKRDQAMKRRAAIQGIYVEDVNYQHILERDGYFCYICEKPILHHHRLEFDHVIPLIPKDGDPIGTHTDDNIRPSHKECNARKNNRRLDELNDYDRRGPDN